MQPNQDKWTEVLEMIRPRVTSETFATWFEHIRFRGTDGDKVVLQVPNNFFYEYLAQHFGQMLLAETNKVFGVNNIKIKVEETQSQTATPASQSPAPPERKGAVLPLPEGEGEGASQLRGGLSLFDPHLSKAYTFDNFIKGEANKLARSIAMTIATKPMQTAFNPFFLYGPSGVGKSHLVNAIGLKMLETNPGKRVLYVSAHDFLMQYTDSVPKNKFNDFMFYYQSIDCLIIDDIHEISGKAKTQEALFNIFNHLQRNHRQIIFTSDKAPAKLQGFEDRVATRFVMGATAELQRPDEQLRRSILRAKIRKNQLSIPNAVIDYIATNVTDNVRDLEGVINSLLVQSIVNDSEITLPMAESVVSRLVRFKAKVITPELVLTTVSRHYKLTQRELCGASRKSALVKARHIAMYLMQKHTTLSSTQIGQHIGRRDHATVLHATRQADLKIKTRPDFKEEVRAIEQEMTK